MYNRGTKGKEIIYTMSELNIYQRMAKVTEELPTVAKNLIVEVSKNNSYKAVAEVDVLTAVKAVESKWGVYSYPISREIVDTDIIVNTSTYDGKTTERKQLFLRMKTTYRFVNIDKPDEFVEMISYSDGIDSGDKGCGKAMTYGDKYALLKAYKIETGADPDAQASEPLKGFSERLASEKQLATLRRFYDGDKLEKLLQVNGLARLEDISQAKASELISKIIERQGR